MVMMKQMSYFLCLVTVLKVVSAAPTEETVDPSWTNTMTDTDPSTTSESFTLRNEAITEDSNITTISIPSMDSSTTENLNSTSTEEKPQSTEDVIVETMSWDYAEETSKPATPEPTKPTSFATLAQPHALVIVFVFSIRLLSGKLFSRL